VEKQNRYKNVIASLVKKLHKKKKLYAVDVTLGN